MSCHHKKVIGQLSIGKKRGHQNPEPGPTCLRRPVNHPNVRKNCMLERDRLLRLTQVSTRIVTYFTAIKIISHRFSLKKKRKRAREYSRECPNTSSPKRTLSYQARTPHKADTMTIHQQNQTTISHRLIRIYLPRLKLTSPKRVITM
jgi:hypothetical protein